MTADCVSMVAGEDGMWTRTSYLTGREITNAYHAWKLLPFKLLVVSYSSISAGNVDLVSLFHVNWIACGSCFQGNSRLCTVISTGRGCQEGTYFIGFAIVE